MIYTVMYILASVVFSFMVHSIGNTMSPGLLIFLCGFNTLLFFHLINLFSLGKVYTHLFKQDMVLILSAMVFIALATVGSFLVPIYYLPAECLFSYIGGLTLLGSIDSYRKSKHKVDLVQILALSVILCLFYTMIYRYFDFRQYIIFIAATLFVSAVTYGYFVLSYKLYQNGLSSIDVLTVRFWPLVVCSGAWSLGKNHFHQLTVLIFFKIFLMSIVLLVLPIFLSQKSIEKAGPNVHAIFMGFIPLLTLTGDLVFFRQHQLTQLTITFWVLSLLLAIVIATARIIRMKSVVAVRE